MYERMEWSKLGPNETTKSKFNSYDLFPDVNLINRFNVLLISHILRFPAS